jgi:hypothetical protein
MVRALSVYGVTHKHETDLMIGSWSQPLKPGKQPSASILSSNRHEDRGTLEYTKEDIEHIEKWGKPETFALLLTIND